ncbi:M20/M25/M40 family metallo-hydrolase [Actinomadura sp. 7K534]|uniref:M20/M25/M40 family metallo-hydrolase n=1 Tax=Actinomadura sp. 7K534 TaxID=2530366 RepID=UPI0010522C80|nr:M20/M25/M40 family metallo-hydrolase [Actinomadura sp. 7K534]TDB94674.1 M20/M25/M40 family metallo-hydrolase [Actinomadura sp. 7K534]
MAPGRGRLGPFLSRAPEGADIVRALQVLADVPSPYGHEAAAAVRLASWCTARWPWIDWDVQRYGRGGANLQAGDPRGVLLYSHLDTSLSGDPAEDRPITARADALPPLKVTASEVTGFGLGVARAPAAAALIAFVSTASRGIPARLLLAGSGTHRSMLHGPGGITRSTGLDHYLATEPRPSAAIVAKGGPPTILWEEPGALYLRLRVVGRHGAVLARESADPPGGVIAHAGPVIEAVERWRAAYVASNQAPGTQVGPAAGIGSLTAGRPDKPDLFPALLEAGIYVVTVPEADPQAIAAALRSEVETACANGPLAGCTIEVDVDEIHPAAATPADAPLVRTARTAWQKEFGAAPPPITGWTGSTDGVALRAHGIDTVRLGPASRPSAEDPRCDVLDLASLAAYARLYAQLLS